jgi:hypothetical protein
MRSDKKLVLHWRQRPQVLGQYGTRCKTECAAIFLQINQSGRRKPATTGEKKMQKPTIAEICAAILGFAALAVFVFMLLAY